MEEKTVPFKICALSLPSLPVQALFVCCSIFTCCCCFCCCCFCCGKCKSPEEGDFVYVDPEDLEAEIREEEEGLWLAPSGKCVFSLPSYVRCVTLKLEDSGCLQNYTI